MRTAVPIIGRQQKPSGKFLYGQLYIIESKAGGRNISYSIEMPKSIGQTDRVLNNGPPATTIGSRIVDLHRKFSSPSVSFTAQPSPLSLPIPLPPKKKHKIQEEQNPVLYAFVDNNKLSEIYPTQNDKA